MAGGLEDGCLQIARMVDTGKIYANTHNANTETQNRENNFIKLIYTTFLTFARKYQDREIVDEKWKALLKFESELMRERGKLAKIHG